MKSSKTRSKEIYRPINIKMDRYKKELRKKATPAELKFKKLLIESGVKFKFQKAFWLHNFQCIVDFYIATGSTFICVEIDGGYHLDENQQRRDQFRTDWLNKNRKCIVVRFTNEEVLTDPGSCLISLSTVFFNNCNCLESNNYKAFCAIAGKPVPEKKQRNHILAQPEWGNEEPLF